MILEIVLRLGAWDQHMHPRSFVKNATRRVAVAEEIGKENIHWISVGNSSFDWGVNHRRIRQMMNRHKREYLRFGFESGGFMSMQTSADWAVKNMPRLEGIIVGMPLRDFASFNDPRKTYKVSWPFLQELDSGRYVYFRDLHKPFAKPFKTAIGIYGPDILDFLHHPLKRMEKASQLSHLDQTENILNYNRDMKKDLCHLSLNSLPACVETARKLKKQTRLKGQEKFIRNVCGAPSAVRRSKNNRPVPSLTGKEERQLTRNWITFLESLLERRKKVYLTLMPEHSLMNYAIRSPSAERIFDAVRRHFSGNPRFQLLDLRNTFLQHGEIPECSLFNDPLHFNNNGKKLFTDALVKHLEPLLEEKATAVK